MLTFVIDGEAVILGIDGVPDFYAFDILALDGDDLRGLLPSLRKTNLAQLLRGRSDGIFVAPFEQGEIGPDLFRAEATWASRAWCRSVPIVPIAPAAAVTGSK